jgi:spore maturation protein SpmA
MEATMSANDYAEQVVDNFIREITDHVFLSIERDDNVMRDYMTNVNRYGLDAVNMAIGMKIKERLALDNDGENTGPKSRLIKSYTFHKVTQR